MLAECSQFLNQGYGIFIGLFLTGLAGGATHCTAMCGPYVLGQIGMESEGSGTPKHGDKILPFYHLGRMTTYVSLAVLSATVFNLVFVTPSGRAFIAVPLLLTAAAIFLASAVPALARVFPWAVRGLPLLPMQWIYRLATPLMQPGGMLKQYMLGVVLGFMPCGLVLSALMMGMAAPHLWQSALGMALFAVGTMPALIGIGYAGKFLKTNFPAAARGITPIIMIFNSFWLVSLAIQSMK